jgi:hypothetical protein
MGHAERHSGSQDGLQQSHLGHGSPQVLRLEFDQMCFKIGECIEDFVVLLASIVKDDLELLEDPVGKQVRVLTYDQLHRVPS